MKLLIVESPAKAKTISKYLDGKYTVKASIGHVRDLPKSNKKAVDIEGGFIPHYEISKGKEKVVSELQDLSRKADEIVLATDPDREGEAIAWHISELITDQLGNSKFDLPAEASAQAGIRPTRAGGNSKFPPIKRVTYHEITKEAIEEALKHPREIDENLRRAQEARRVLDRLVGYDLSGIIWKKVRYGLSAGRVQSPALRILMEREREIRAFKSHKFYVITADLAKGKEKMTFTCEKEPTEKSEVEKIVKKGKESSWTVSDVTETEAKRYPRAPFITSTLQQAASSRLGMSPSRTMSVAQKLYEAGHITYMRTDSTTLSSNALRQISAVVEKKFGKGDLQLRTFAKKSKNAQEAHEAIRPTNMDNESAGMGDAEKKLYRLIWERTVASQMADANILRTRITARPSPEVATSARDRTRQQDNIGTGTLGFIANGSRVLSLGWLKADQGARGEDVEVPKLKAGDSLELLKIETQEKETEPPPRYSEAGLVKELEKRGIGRPSTYASIIKTLEDRGYVEKVNKALVPTDTGDVVSTFLEDNFPEYISDTFTASMEDSLDEIAGGKKEYSKTLHDYYVPLQKEVKAKEKLAKATNLGDADPKFKCPVCGGPMIIKLSKTGKFISCARFPDCTGALTMEGKEIKPEEPIGVHPETGEDIYLLHGRFGYYIQLGPTSPKATRGKPDEKGLPPARAGGAQAGGGAAPSAAHAGKGGKKPRRASVPKDKDPNTITVEDAVKYLSLPRVLGTHPQTGKEITANIGRFGPYVVHDGDFRSIKAPDDVYSISLARAIEILSQEKKSRFGKRKKE